MNKPPYDPKNKRNKKMQGLDGDIWKSINKQWKKIKTVDKKKPLVFNLMNNKTTYLYRNGSHIKPKSKKQMKLKISQIGHLKINMSSKYVPEINDKSINCNLSKLKKLCYELHGNVLAFNFIYQENLFSIWTKFKSTKLMNVIVDILNKAGAVRPLIIYPERMKKLHGHHFGDLIPINKKNIKKITDGEKYYVVGEGYRDDFIGKCISVATNKEMDNYLFLIEKWRNNFRIPEDLEEARTI